MRLCIGTLTRRRRRNRLRFLCSVTPTKLQFHIPTYFQVSPRPTMGAKPARRRNRAVSAERPTPSSEPEIRSEPSGTSEPGVGRVPREASEPKQERVPRDLSEPREPNASRVPYRKSEPFEMRVPHQQSDPSAMRVPRLSSKRNVGK